MPRHVRRFRRSRPTGSAGHGAQVYVPTTSTKALVAALVTLAGLAGIQLTDGTAQLVVMALQLVCVVFGVWRARNRPKLPAPPAGPGVGEFL